jgi:hypothetical protein
MAYADYDNVREEKFVETVIGIFRKFISENRMYENLRICARSEREDMLPPYEITGSRDATGLTLESERTILGKTFRKNLVFVTSPYYVMNIPEDQGGNQVQYSDEIELRVGRKKRFRKAFLPYAKSLIAALKESDVIPLAR